MQTMLELSQNGSVDSSDYLDVEQILSSPQIMNDIVDYYIQVRKELVDKVSSSDELKSKSTERLQKRYPAMDKIGKIAIDKASSGPLVECARSLIGRIGGAANSTRYPLHPSKKSRKSRGLKINAVQTMREYFLSCNFEPGDEFTFCPSMWAFVFEKSRQAWTNAFLPSAPGGLVEGGWVLETSGSYSAYTVKVIAKPPEVNPVMLKIKELEEQLNELKSKL